MSYIIHFTTVHPRNDTRIRLKQVATLSRIWPGQVALYVQDGQGDETDARDGFAIHDTGRKAKGRLNRMTIGAWRMYRAVRRARPRVAHFHDPELLPWAVLLRLSGMQVIYDVHEDLPASVLSKSYIPRWLRRPIAAVVGVVERLLASVLTRVVAATPAISSNFPRHEPVLVQNFPLLTELQLDPAQRVPNPPPHFAYVGGVTAIRGAVEMVTALGVTQDSRVRLQMAGSISERLADEIEAVSGWERVKFHGWADRPAIAEILSQCRAGLVLFHPVPNHIRAQPNKMFEYMAAGLPVIASDFPLWREIVEGAGCGLLVNPLDPKAIADAIQWIIDHPDEAAEMGRRGRTAIEQRYNWEAESDELVALYSSLIKKP